MLTVCFAWDDVQMDPSIEWRVWRQLRGAFGINRMVACPVKPEMSNVSVEQYASMAEAVASCDGTVVLLRPGGDKHLLDIPISGDVTIVVGSTLEDLSGVSGDMAVNIECANPVDLYGFNAAAIALQARL